MKTVNIAAALLAVCEVAIGAGFKRDNDSATDLAYSPPYYPSPWMDPQAEGWQEAYVQAEAFVSELTLLEKVNLTTGTGWMADKCVGNVGSIERIGWRGLCMQDGPQGIRFADYVSFFTSSQLAAATWDRDLIHERGYAMASEARDKGANVLLGPSVGPLGRFPTGGRNWEGFSPDPYLSGIAVAEAVQGIQEAGVIANVKHLIMNEQEHFRDKGAGLNYGYDVVEAISSNVDDKTMHELYLWPFADAIHAGAGSVMCSYQQINNSYGCQNSAVLNNLLKGELGFQGFVLTDWQAQHTGVASAVAGLDMSMPGDVTFNSRTSYWGANLTNAVLNGTVPEYRIDDMAMRIMAAFFKVGGTVEGSTDINFSSWSRDTEGPLHFAAQERVQTINEHIDVRQDHGELIRRIASHGTVLLKNEGALPLDKPKFIAVIGEDAGGRKSGPNGCPDQGCNEGTLAASWGSGTASFTYLITPDAGIQRRAVDDGTRYESILSNWEHEATTALVGEPNCTAIVFVNANSGEGYITVDDNIGDRNNLTLWNGGDDLIKVVAANNPNTIVVIHSTGPVIVSDWYENPNITAILWAGLPGQESGNAIADVLYGDVNPGGKTPFTWGASEEDYGVKIVYEPNNGDDAPQDNFEEGVFIDYRGFDSKNLTPIYEFGFGLSYTTFEFSDLQIENCNAGEYVPNTGESGPARTIGVPIDPDYSGYVYPDGFHRIDQFIYPYLNSTDPSQALGDPHYGSESSDFLPPGTHDESPRPAHPAGGGSGGNPQLWDVMYTVTATVTNTGDLAGDEVAQLYVSLGGPDDPVRVLRGFDRITLESGASETFRAEIRRRDLSNWDVVSQNWVISEYPKTVYVGNSSRNLPLQAPLE